MYVTGFHSENFSRGATFNFENIRVGNLPSTTSSLGNRQFAEGRAEDFIFTQLNLPRGGKCPSSFRRYTAWSDASATKVIVYGSRMAYMLINRTRKVHKIRYLFYLKNMGSLDFTIVDPQGQTSLNTFSLSTIVCMSVCWYNH